MDPLSIAASVVGLLSAGVKVSTVLNNFVRDFKDIPSVANGVLQEVTDISSCLAQLQAFLLATRVGSRSRTALIMVEQVVVTLTACVMTFSELEEALESLTHDASKQLTRRLAWLRKEPTLEKLCRRLNTSKSSLSLMLTTLTCVSVDQATTSVETLTNLVRQVLQTNQNLCSRLGSLESIPSNRSVRSNTPLTESEGEDDASTIRPVRHISDPISGSSEPQETGVRRFTFENDLRHSKVYKRVKRRNSFESLTSSSAPSFGWSCLSEMSLAAVSNISVISLPIAPNELSNGAHYHGPLVAHQILGKAMPRKLGIADITQISLASSTRPANITRSELANSSPRDVRGQWQSNTELNSYASKNIAILGTSLSGKTTVYRQLKSLHGYEMLDYEREECRLAILNNLRTASFLLYSNFEKVNLICDARKRKVDLVPHYDSLSRKEMKWDQATLVKYLEAFRWLLNIWDFRHLIRSEDREGLNDNIEFFSHRLDSLFIEDCRTADTDVFHARTEPTTGCDSYSYLTKAVQWQTTDHGGHKLERGQTWPTTYQSADYIIFTVALSGYCRTSLDGDGVNQMLDAMESFAEVAANVRVHAPVIVMFTKIDVFEKLLETYCFTDFFPQYRGPVDASSICMYFTYAFRALDPRPQKQTYIRVVNAADPVDFADVWKEVESRILLEPRDLPNPPWRLPRTWWQPQQPVHDQPQRHYSTVKGSTSATSNADSAPIEFDFGF